MDFVDEQNIARIQIGQDCGQIPRLGQHGPRGHLEIHAQFARHDLGQRGFPQARRAVEQGVIHRLTAPPRAFDKHTQVRAGLGLTDEFVQPLRAQGAVGIFGLTLGAQGGIRAFHGSTDYPFGANRRKAVRIKSAVLASGSSPAACATALAASDGL